jgi:hypothetical protein
MAIIAGKVVINDKVASKQTLLQTRNISLADQISRENAIPIKQASNKISVIEDGIEKEVFKTSKYLEDLTSK